MRPHSWDQRAAQSAEAAPLSQHRWDEVAGSDSDEAPDYEETDGEAFVSYLTKLYLAKDLSAKDFCCIMHLAGKAGIKDAVPLGYPPNSPSGHYNRHLRKTMPFLSDASVLYKFEVPSSQRVLLNKEGHTAQAIPLHEALDASFKSQPGLLDQLDQAIAQKTLPPAYFDHPIVKASRTWVFPVSIFLDGVPYSHTDSVTGVWLINELTGERHLVLALRKKTPLCLRMQRLVHFLQCLRLSGLVHWRDGQGHLPDGEA